MNNSTVSVTAEDSVSFTFYNLDSLGQNIGGLDSTFILVSDGAGDSVFSEVITGVTGRVKMNITASDTAYSWSALVADIDGVGNPGVYSVSIVARSDATGGWLKTPFRNNFQLVGWELDNMGDSCGLAAVKTAETIDSLNTVLDSLFAVLDTLQAGFGSQALHDVNMARISGDDQAANSLEAMLDGSGGGTLTLSKLKVISVDTGVIIRGLGGAPGIFVEGGATGSAVEFCAGSNAGDGFKITADNGHGLIVTGGGDGHFDVSADIHGSLDTLLNPPESISVFHNDKVLLASLTADSVLVDSLSYRGSGGAGDSTSIARWVWNTPQANHTLSGTFGKYLDSEISGLASGSGMYAYSLLTFDSSSGQVIPGVGLAVRNINQSALIATGRSDMNGLAAFNLDTDSFLVVADATGFIFDTYDTIIVTGSGTDTVYGYRFDPGEPSAPELCRVYGYLYDLEGDPVGQATVAAYLPQGVTRSGGRVVSPFTVSATTDSTGYFFLDLIPSDSLIPSSTSYEMTIHNQDGTIFRKRLKVPVTSGWQLVW